MKKNIFFIGAVFTAFVFSGCSTKEQLSCSIPGGCGNTPKRVEVEHGDDNLKIPAFDYKPIIGTRNNDAKTIVDTGVVLKIYIPTYKDSKKMLVAAHDRYVWAKEPGFVVGTERPDVRKRTGLMTSAGKVPFVFGEGEIDAASIDNNSKIKDYLNAVSEAEKRDTAALENLEAADDRFDKVIKGYVEKTKGVEK